MSKQEANEIVRAAERVRRSGRALKVALPTAAVLGAGAALAVGSIGGGNTITGCYNNEKGPKGESRVITISGVDEAPGALRVIDPTITAPPSGAPAPDPAGACQPGEETITWNQQGPQGPAGPQGSAGPQGAQGSQGPQGPAGQEPPGATTFGLSNSSGKTFLKLDGIKGESSDSKHKGEIEISSFSWGVSNPSSYGSGGGGGAGKTTIQTFKITKTVDKASPLLFKAASQGTHIKYGELLLARKAGGKQQDYLYIKMENILISGAQDSPGANGKPQENITFAFQKATETFLAPNGKREATVQLNFSTAKL